MKLARIALCAVIAATPSCEARTEHMGRPGLRFDPARLQVGDQVGTLTVDSIAAQVTPADSSLVGVARFRGEIQISGTTMRTPDPDMRNVTSCFEADSSSAARLPRWQGDERRSWFCFENQPEALAALGPPSDGVQASVVIERFTINRGLSDQVNSARFVRVTQGISR